MTILVAGEDGRQIETEAVDVHLLLPEFQTVTDQSLGHRVRGIERVAAPGVVGVETTALVEDVEGRLSKPR